MRVTPGKWVAGRAEERKAHQSGGGTQVSLVTRLRRRVAEPGCGCSMAS
jgi:hypothetical protein